MTSLILATFFISVGMAQGFGKFSVYMEEKCGETVLVDVFGKHAGRLRPTRTTKYKPNMSCTVTIQTAESHRFVVVFRRLDVEYEPFCDDDFLQIHDGNTTSAPFLPGLPRKICGEERPEGDYVTSGSSMTVFFKSDSWSNDYGFDFIFTIFHTGSCVEGEMKCTNGRCISMYLECDGWNNCGDDSDECPLSTIIVLGVVVSVIFLTLIATSMIICVRRRYKNQATKEKKKEDPKLYCIHDQNPTTNPEGEGDKSQEHTATGKGGTLTRTAEGLPW